MKNYETNSDIIISEFSFNEDGKQELETLEKSKNWPVVYIIHNDEEMYIGETNSMYNRFNQHYYNSDKNLRTKRRRLKTIKIIFDEEFNKSAILDIEQNLINLFFAENKFKLQNRNGGQSEKHNYYQREKYIDKFNKIWDTLHELKLTDSSIEDIKNKDLFKYSPYNTLTSEQNNVCYDVIDDIINSLKNNKNGTCIINGGAGTGKTILLINIIYKIVTAMNDNVSLSDDEDFNDSNLLLHKVRKYVKELGRPLKIGFVVPMSSLRETIGNIFKETNGLKKEMVLRATQVTSKCDEPDFQKFDIIFVDEAHRLKKRKNITSYDSFDDAAIRCGLDPNETNELEFIVKNSKYRVLVYDLNQTVKGSDITDEEFKKAIHGTKILRKLLTTQMRCKGGEEYTSYLNDIFNCNCKERKEIKNYDFKIFDDVDDMVNTIKILDKVYGLCRNAAGYSWEWSTRKKKCESYQEAIDRNIYDIHIGNYKYIWNMTSREFINSPNAINEIGCVHTLQGYDLNYVGVILGREIDYDDKNNKIIINKKLFFDQKVKSNVDDKQLMTFIINAYKVLMSRGIKGCYVYAYNENLRNYLKKYILTKEDN